MTAMDRVEFGAAIAEDLASGEKNTVREVRDALNDIMDSTFVKADDTTDDITEGITNLFFTPERVDDRVAALLQPGANVTLTYDDNAGTITIAAVGGGEGAEGAVLLATYNAHTILAAVTDDNPVAVTVAEQTLVGRITGGNITALSADQILTLLNVTAGAQPCDSTNVDNAGAVMNSDYNANSILIATTDNTPTVLTVEEQTLIGRLNGGAITALIPAQIRTLINVEDGASNNAGLTTVEVSNSDETVPNQITTAENGKTFTNEGVLSTNYHKLPADGIGIEYTFMVVDTDGIRVLVGDPGHTIRVGDLITEAGGYIEATSPGASITLKRVNSTLWVAKMSVGLWTVSQYVPPVDGGGGEDEGTIVNGLLALWDAKAYVSGQTFANTTPDPNYQSGKSDLDLWLGLDGDTNPDEPLFIGNAFEVIDADNFFKAKNTAPVSIANAHKTQTGTSWTFWAKIKTPLSVATVDTIFSTAANTGDRGIKIRCDSTGTLKFDHYDGTTLKTVAASQKLVADKRYDIFVGYDYTANQLKFCVTNPELSNTIFEVVTANLTNAITGAATYPVFTIGADADVTSHFELGVKLYGAGWVDHSMDNTELADFIAWSDGYYSPEAVVLPDRPTRIITMGGHQKAHFNVVVASTGGASILDFAIQKKLASDPDTSFANHSHTASGALDITCTGLTNNTAYSFRFATITSAGQSDWSNSINVTPVAEGTNPYDEQYYKITEPVTLSGQRIKGTGIRSREITQPAFLTHSSAFFGRADGKFIFQCPNFGATTSDNAKYTRSELRHLTNIPNESASEDTIRFAVTELANGHKTIVHQIHGFGSDDAPYFKTQVVRNSNGTATIYTLAKLTSTSGDVKKTLLANYTIGDIVKIRAVFSGTTLAFYVNDSPTPIYVPTTSEGSDIAVFDRLTAYYWKRGNYYQNLEGDSDGNGGTWPYSICTVEHYTEPGIYIP